MNFYLISRPDRDLYLDIKKADNDRDFEIKTDYSLASLGRPVSFLSKYNVLLLKGLSITEHDFFHSLIWHSRM